MMDTAISQLVAYGIEKELLAPCDAVYTANRLLSVLGREAFSPVAVDAAALPPLEKILAILLDDAVSHGVIDDNIVARDLFDTALMGCLTPPPSVVQKKFQQAYQISPQAATDWYYRFSRDTDYIRRYRIEKDLRWVTATRYGELDITINLSKPEKDPKAIAAAKDAPQVGYPTCMLCRENEGYAGRMNHPARQNHRIIPITIAGADWFFQYSPYVYYNEHCIVLNGKHTPMRIERATFEKLFDFVRAFPHYFVGSNADLPIVGGSILSHDHFQGGHYTFAMEKAKLARKVSFASDRSVTAGIVDWPMSVLRLSHADPDRLIALGDRILAAWRGYTDPAAFIFAETDGVPHNTITPIARKRGAVYELDLVLRNNITTPEHPLGVYHPHAALHHIKKENIGLIEVMGLAVLPARLKTEMEELERAMLAGENLQEQPMLQKHADWAMEILERYPDFSVETATDILRLEIGKVFAKVLEDAGVYKRDAAGEAAFARFLSTVEGTLLA